MLELRDYRFLELTRSLCPECRAVVDARVIDRGGKVYMRKRCAEHGYFESLISSDVEIYLGARKYNVPGKKPRKFFTEVKDGCPTDCGLCPDHEQHTCLALIDITDACNLRCPTCFADARGHTFMSPDHIARLLEQFVEAEGRPEILQLSGGEPTVHPQVREVIERALSLPIGRIMLNTNGVRLAKDDRFLEFVAGHRDRLEVYLQFDGFRPETSVRLRGEDLTAMKRRCVERLSAAGIFCTLVAAIEKGVNDDEMGEIVRYGIATPYVAGVSFQPVFSSGRYLNPIDPLDRMTLPDVILGLEAQTDGMFRRDDFAALPCSHPNCCSLTYAYVDGGQVRPIPRYVDIEAYLGLIGNTISFEGVAQELQRALTGLWSETAAVTSPQLLRDFCSVCGLGDVARGLAGRIFGTARDERRVADMSTLQQRLFRIVIKPFMDVHTFDLARLMKCCIHQITSGAPDDPTATRLIPFCAYNTLFREPPSTTPADFVPMEALT